MDEKIQVLGVKFDNYSAKEALQHIVQYMKEESIQVVEMISLDTLKSLLLQEEWEDKIETFDMTLAGDKAILEAAEVVDEKRLKEAEVSLFFKMFMRYLHSEKATVFILAEDETVLDEVQNYIEKNFSKIKIVETATVVEQSVSEDMVLNLINGVEPDCILAAMSSPYQQDFIIRNRLMLNSRVWFGVGTKVAPIRKKSGLQKIKDQFNRHILKRQAAKVRQKDS